MNLFLTFLIMDYNVGLINDNSSPAIRKDFDQEHAAI